MPPRKPTIIEDHIQTKDIWRTITNEIDSADLFVADVSSSLFNIALELGYALGDHISVMQWEKILFKADFSKGVYAEHYTSYPHKEGQIGFRCRPVEEAVINYVEVREL